MDRRSVLRAAAFATASVPLGMFLHSEKSGARVSSRRPLLVVVFLRGGVDGLALVPPLSERGVATMRGELHPSDSKPFAGESTEFGLHPALDRLREATHIEAVHATGLVRSERSHFAAQTLCERSAASGAGWLAEALAAVPTDDGFPGVAVSSLRPEALTGSSRALTLENTDVFSSPARGAADDALRAMWAPRTGETERFARAGRSALRAMDLLERESRRALPSDVRFARGPAGRRFETLARLLRADLGVAAACVDVQGFDTHVRQGGNEGMLANRLAQVADSTRALLQIAEETGHETLTLWVTEFGRTVRPNGSGGTDHGRGSAALLMGPAIAANRVAGNWPGLGPDALADGRDLAVTTDIRHVFARGVAHLGLDPTRVFGAEFSGGSQRA